MCGPVNIRPVGICAGHLRNLGDGKGSADHELGNTVLYQGFCRVLQLGIYDHVGPIQCEEFGSFFTTFFSENIRTVQ